MKNIEIITNSVAVVFSNKLKEVMTDENMAEIVKRNHTERIDQICHSHDFCDANMLMADAIKDSVEGWESMSASAYTEIWNTAWDIAKQKNFYTEEKIKT